MEVVYSNHSCCHITGSMSCDILKSWILSVSSMQWKIFQGFPSRWCLKGHAPTRSSLSARFFILSVFYECSKVVPAFPVTRFLSMMISTMGLSNIWADVLDFCHTFQSGSKWTVPVTLSISTLRTYWSFGGTCWGVIQPWPTETRGVGVSVTLLEFIGVSPRFSRLHVTGGVLMA